MTVRGRTVVSCGIPVAPPGADIPENQMWRTPKICVAIAAVFLTACNAPHDNVAVATLSAEGEKSANTVQQPRPAFSSYDEARTYARGGNCETADMSRSRWIRSAEFCYRGATDRGFLIMTLDAREYIHADVPTAVWDAFREAPSPGEFYNARLRRQFRLSLVGE